MNTLYHVGFKALIILGFSTGVWISQAWASAGVPDGVYTHYITTVGPNNYFKTMGATLTLPTTLQRNVYVHLQGREALDGPGPSGQNRRIGLQAFSNGTNYSYNTYWTDNTGAGAASPTGTAQLGDSIKLTVTYTLSTSSYKAVAVNQRSLATSTLTWGTAACPANPISAFRLLLMTQSMTDCDQFDPASTYTMSNIQLISNDNLNQSSKPFSFEQLGTSCSASGASSHSESSGTYTLGK